MMLQIWYSALIPSRVLRLVRENPLQLVQDVCTKIKAIAAENLQAKTLIYDMRSLRLVLMIKKNNGTIPSGISRFQTKHTWPMKDSADPLQG